MARMKFYLTSLGEDRFILGYLFLYAINPNMDWQGEKLHRGPIRLETIGFRKAEQRVEECQRIAHRQIGATANNKEVWMRRSTIAQQWVREAHKKDEDRTLPKEYQRHEKVFDEERAKRFPPK